MYYVFHALMHVLLQVKFKENIKYVPEDHLASLIIIDKEKLRKIVSDYWLYWY